MSALIGGSDEHIEREICLQLKVIALLFRINALDTLPQRNITTNQEFPFFPSDKKKAQHQEKKKRKKNVYGKTLPRTELRNFAFLSLPVGPHAFQKIRKEKDSNKLLFVIFATLFATLRIFMKAVSSLTKTLKPRPQYAGEI